MAPLRLVALVGLFLVVASCFLAVRSPVAAALRSGEPLSGILLGTDFVETAQHSDTLMLWYYSPRRAHLDVLSLPRDTRINLPGFRFHRINEVFAYHFALKRDPRFASGEVLKAVAYLLNFKPIYYLHVNFDGFRRFIDLIGGLNVHIDEPLHYDDNAGDYHFHREPGDYHLSGDEALAYVRFRGRSGDRGRILRQMEFLKGVAEKISFPLLAFRWPKMLATVYGSVHTNLGLWDVPFLVLEAKHLRPDRLNPWLLPGQNRGVYWEMDVERTGLVLRQITGQENGSAEAVAEEEPVSPAATHAKVKVWNGSGRSGLALKVTRRLRAGGFDVLEWGNYNLRQTKTRVLDRCGDIDKARGVARLLGVESVFSDINPKLQTDVEVILGEDYTGETR